MSNPISFNKHWLLAMAGATSLLLASTTQAGLVTVNPNTPETPGALLGGGTTGLLGAVIASQQSTFVGTTPDSQSFTGLLRSMVVNTPTGYDFYYQAINLSQEQGNDIFRLTLPGYGQSLVTSATFRTDGLAGLTGVPSGFLSSFTPNKGANGNVYSADRDPNLSTPAYQNGGFGFDFDQSQIFNINGSGAPTSAPGNIDSGQSSNWLIVRTNTKVYGNVSSALSSGGGTGLASAYAPIPEPTAMIFGIAMLGICAGGRFRKSRA